MTAPPYNNVWVAGGAVVSIGTPPPGGGRTPLAYTGVQVVDRKMLTYIPPQGAYDLVQAWREAIAAGERLACLTVSGHFWQDLGTPENYLAAHRRLLARRLPEVGPVFSRFDRPPDGARGQDRGRGAIRRRGLSGGGRGGRGGGRP